MSLHTLLAFSFLRQSENLCDGTNLSKLAMEKGDEKSVDQMKMTISSAIISYLLLQKLTWDRVCQ